MITAAEFDRTVLAEIRRHPDIRADEIAKAIGTPVANVSAALRRLKKARAVRRRGNTKGTTYRVRPRP
jgi:DNA-binding MarR family transcriptional regulator